MKINGVPVVDAKNKIVLHITEKDCQLGDNKNPAACAAAQCLLRKPNVEQARVHIGRTYLLVKGKWHRYKTTEALRSEIIAFDRGGTFEPGTYALNPLSPWEVASGRRQGTDAPGARDEGSKDRTPKKPRRKYHQVTGIRHHGAVR